MALNPQRPARALDVALRPAVEHDLPTLFRFQLDPEANRLAGVKPLDEPAFRARWDRIFADPSVTTRVILADGALAGSISRFTMDGLDAVGYWIARDQWNRGIATRGIGLFLREAPARPLHAHVASHNTASLRALERNGFVVTGTHAGEETDRFVACEIVSLVLA